MERRRPPLQLIPASGDSTRGVLPSAIRKRVNAEHLQHALNSRRTITLAGLLSWLQAVTAYAAAYDQPGGITVDLGTLGGYFEARPFDHPTIRAALKLAQDAGVIERQDGDRMRLAADLWITHKLFGSTLRLPDLMDRIDSTRRETGRGVSAVMVLSVYNSIVERFISHPRATAKDTVAERHIQLSVPDVAQDLGGPPRNTVRYALDWLHHSECLVLDRRWGKPWTGVRLPPITAPGDSPSITPTTSPSEPVSQAPMAADIIVSLLTQINELHDKGELTDSAFKQLARTLLSGP